MQAKLLLFLLVTSLAVTVYGQTFKKWSGDFHPQKIIRYSNLNAQFIIQKTLSPDTNSTIYEIGLITFTKTIRSDDFMFEGGQIVFDDKTTLIFQDVVNIVYHYSGKHQFSLRHRLSAEELEMIQTKKINFFKVYDYGNKLDKWQKEDVLEACNKIVAEE